MKKAMRSILVVSLILTAFSLKSAERAFADHAPIPNLVISTGDNFPPYTDLDLPHGGMTTLTVNRAFEIMGSRIQELQWLPWKRSFEIARKGEIDGTFPWNYSEERTVDFLFSDAIRTIPRFAWTSAKHTGSLNTREDLKGKTLCRPLGYGMFGYTKDLLEQGDIQRMTPNTIEQCFKLLVNGRVDFVEAVKDDATGAMERAEISTDLIFQSSFITYESDQHFLVSKKNPRAQQIIEIFNEGLKRLRETGEMDEITRQFTQ